MRRLSVAVLALGVLAQVATAAVAAPSPRAAEDVTKLEAGSIVVSAADARALNDQIDLLRALARTAPVKHAAGDAAAADTLELLEAVEDAVVVVPGKRDNACVITYVNRVLNTFQSIYYYWIHYPFYGLAEVEWGAQVMVRCLLQR